MTDDALPVFTPKYRAVQEDGGFRVTFFCDICDRGYTHPLIRTSSLQEALRLGAGDARLHFNRCGCCHRWVCDEHFNENQMMCTECALCFCTKCGAFVPKGNQFCTVCGKPQFKMQHEGRKRHD